MLCIIPMSCMFRYRVWEIESEKMLFSISRFGMFYFDPISKISECDWKCLLCFECILFLMVFCRRRYCPLCCKGELDIEYINDHQPVYGCFCGIKFRPRDCNVVRLGRKCILFLSPSLSISLSVSTLIEHRAKRWRVKMRKKTMISI